MYLVLECVCVCDCLKTERKSIVIIFATFSRLINLNYETAHSSALVICLMHTYMYTRKDRHIQKCHTHIPNTNTRIETHMQKLEKERESKKRERKKEVHNIINERKS